LGDLKAGNFYLLKSKLLFDVGRDIGLAVDPFPLTPALSPGALPLN